jgi:hypothetical protein
MGDYDIIRVEGRPSRARPARTRGRAPPVPRRDHLHRPVDPRGRISPADDAGDGERAAHPGGQAGADAARPVRRLSVGRRLGRRGGQAAHRLGAADDSPTAGTAGRSAARGARRHRRPRRGRRRGGAARCRGLDHAAHPRRQRGAEDPLDVPALARQRAPDHRRDGLSGRQWRDPDRLDPIPVYTSAVRSASSPTAGCSAPATCGSSSPRSTSTASHPRPGGRRRALHPRDHLGAAAADRRLLRLRQCREDHRIAAACSAATDDARPRRLPARSRRLGRGDRGRDDRDKDGNETRAVTSVYLAGDDDWWFGGDNGDRMDIIPDAKPTSGDTAHVQVRMPFRKATALVTVEREGVLSSFVTELSGKDPVVDVKLPGAYAPDVYHLGDGGARPGRQLAGLARRARASDGTCPSSAKDRQSDRPGRSRQAEPTGSG